MTSLSFPVDFRQDGGLGELLWFDATRATIDPGFPCDPHGHPFPMEDWKAAPPDAYRYQYLYVPFVHRDDGWEANPSEDTRTRVYCRYSPGERLRIRGLGTLTIERVAPERIADVWYWRVQLQHAPAAVDRAERIVSGELAKEQDSGDE